MVDLKHFSAFRAVMLTGTVSGAADILHKSQPSVSRLIDKLEAELGIALFERRRGLITPTAAAQLLLDEVERAYVSIESLKNFAATVAEEESSRIATAIMPALGITFIPPILAQFRKEWPRTKILLNIRLSAKIEEWAASQQIDFGMAETPLRRSGFQIDMFSDMPYVAVIPASHPLVGRGRVTPADFAGESFISWASFTAAGQIIGQAFRTAGIKLEPAYATTISAAAFEMVKQGLGVSLVDPYTAVKLLDDSVRLVPFFPSVPFNVALLRPETRPLSRAAEALLDMMSTERNRLMEQLPR